MANEYYTGKLSPKTTNIEGVNIYDLATKQDVQEIKVAINNIQEVNVTLEDIKDLKDSLSDVQGLKESLDNIQSMIETQNDDLSLLEEILADEIHAISE